MAEVETYEGEGENVIFSEDLFEKLQSSLQKLVRTYQIDENHLQNLLHVISQLWEQLDESSSKLEKLDEQQKDMEKVWNEEKEKRRQAEKKRTELENRFDEERYQWHAERQELQRDRVGLVTRIKHLEERHKELVNDYEAQSEKFEQDQKLRNDLVEQYKKQYEIAKTSTLKRKKGKKQTLDYSGGEEPFTKRPNSVSPVSTKPSMGEVPETSSVLPLASESEHPETMQSQSSSSMESAPGRNRRQLPKNMISLKTELKHPKGQKQSVDEGPEDFIYQEEEDKYYEIETQEELLTSGPELLVVPTVAEVDMLKREQEESKQTIVDLQRRLEEQREDRETLERDNAQLCVDVEQYMRAIADYQHELAQMRQERDEILESYLDQPFDVYCVTKKELHEVLKKLHATQIEMQKQTEEKQSLESQLLAKKKKKSPWKKFSKKVRNMFQSSRNQNSSSKSEEYDILTDEPTMSYQIPPEAPFTPKSPATIKAMDQYRVSRNWLLSNEGPAPTTLPSLYCQVMLKEYHVTDAISCMSLARVYQTTQPHNNSRRTSFLPLAARTAKGRLCVEVWVGSNEGPTSFIEVIDVLSKRIVDRFLVRGNSVVCMESVPGDPLGQQRKTTSSTSSRKDSDSRTNGAKQQLFEDSLDLFAKDDEALEKEKTIKERTRKDSGRSESELRHYYKNRFRKSADLGKQTSVDVLMGTESEKSAITQSDKTPDLKQISSSSFKSTSPSGSSGSLRGESRISSNSSSPSISRVSRGPKASNTPPSVRSSVPVNSLAAELLREDPNNPAVLGPGNGSPLVTANQRQQMFHTHSGGGSLDDQGSMEVFTDDEADGEPNQTSTPLKTNALEDRCFMWVATDSNFIYLYDAVNIAHHPLKKLTLPSRPSCIRYISRKVCVGLSDSRMIIYHQETIVSGGKDCIWDIQYPSFIDLPKLIPENPLPVRDIRLIRGKIWVTTGSFLTLLDQDTLISQGSKFLDGMQSQPNKLLPLDDVVLTSTVKGCNIFLLDPVRAEVLKRINISPASLILDNLLQLTSVNVTNMINDESNVYISTSTGKIFALPCSSFSIKGDDVNQFVKQASMPDPNDMSSASYPPSGPTLDNPLFRCTASSLLTHREGSVRGLVHIPLPEDAKVSMKSNSNINLSSRSLGMFSASSLPSLISDSPPMSRSIIGGGGNSGLSHPTYKSLLVSCGKGYNDYLSDANMFEGSTALREKNEAFQVMVWGYEQSEEMENSGNQSTDDDRTF